MKIIKIGQLNFWKDQRQGDTGYHKINIIINELNKISSVYKYEYRDCHIEECDIVFYSLFGYLSNIKYIKGNPVLIYWTDENLCVGQDYIVNKPFEYYKNNNPSISFYDDSDDNLFFPYFIFFIEEYFNSQKIIKYNNIINKTKFCTFCASNDTMYDSYYRKNIVEYISNNYKQITCCGKVLNNTNNDYLPWDVDKSIMYHKNYKFNICFENSYSSGNLTYLTEKIMKAYIYNTIPIYWGCERVLEWFDSESFINCNNLNKQQILNKIKEIDNDYNLFKYMINKYPFKNKDLNHFEDFCKKLNNFLIKYIS